jgi:Lon protease-like protein
MQAPLFPLNTVLFPDGPLPLRIFEPRYLDMISGCMKQDKPFGVLLIKDGHEAGPATTHSVGTLARVTDWYQGSDGLLGITAIGTERFRLQSVEQQSDGLNVLGRLYEDLERRYDDGVWVAWRFMEILTIDLETKQAMLETGDIPACLTLIEDVLHQ